MGSGDVQTAVWRRPSKVAAIIHNLGYMKGGSGDLAGGMQQFQEALRIAIAQLGEDHPTVGAIREPRHAPASLRRSGRRPGNLERGLEAAEASAGSMHPSVARTGHLGITLQQMGILGAPFTWSSPPGG
jgi:hypothetical protein